MKQLKADFDYSRYLTAFAYCTVFPLEKTKNGFYKCRLTFGKKEHDKVDWIIPLEYLEENGHLMYNKDDVYFARWLVRNVPEVEIDENGKQVLDENGSPKIKELMHFGRLIEFWNTRVFGAGSDQSK